jgi:hypothetical protein
MYFMPLILGFLAICALILARRTGNSQFQTLAFLFFLCGAVITLILYELT